MARERRGLPAGVPGRREPVLRDRPLRARPRGGPPDRLGTPGTRLGAPMVGYLVLVPADRQPPVPPPGKPGPSSAGTRDGLDGAHVPVGDDPLIRIDTARRTAAVAGRELELTYLEFELLAHLVAHPHRVHTRDQLVTTVWGYGHVGDGRTVDVHVARLRRELGAEHRRTIQTVRRVGYEYSPPTGR
ncbi:winged helix-turn-helix domain-containing protein [Streptomyces mutabilis]|uniref:winged helix-turn-helix domain-containing protein n=1 Tax=Streptomyces mutabilis TaxID=67332 RepID=UPI00351A3084